MLRDILTNPAWLAVVVAVVALIPQIIKAGIWSWRKWGEWRNTIPTKSAKDRANYAKLLDQYEKYLSLLEDLIIIRAQHEWGQHEWTPEVEQKFAETRDHVYHSLEKTSHTEDDMGVFQKLDVLEYRTVGLGEQIERRAELRQRQDEIEAHHLFIGRPRDSDASARSRR
jgi:hypothetical protein